MTNHDFITRPHRIKDLTSQRFGRWTALEISGRNRHNQILWLCLCDCGNLSKIPSGTLSSGRSKSCGCLHKEIVSVKQTTHGLYSHPLYRTWNSMVHRCCSPTDKDYLSYGGRGISVFDRWTDNPLEFINYASSLPNCGTEGYTLDRIDNNGNYEPGNIKFSTSLEQGNNKRSCQYFTYLNKTQCLSAWSREFGITRYVLSRRIKKGWSIEKALTTPVRQKTIC